MHRFWSTTIKPLVDAAAPRRMLEIGAGSGQLTEPLLLHCRDTGCTLDVVDAAPAAALRDVVQRHDAPPRLHALRGPHAIPLLPAADIVFLDDDNNWSTVYQELQLLFARAIQTGTAPPIIFVHETAWPYGRRDRYDVPDAMTDRHAYACRGIVPGHSALQDGGLNGTFNNALHEGGPRNGVMTAVEDFVASWPHPVTLHDLPVFNGMAILVPQARETPPVRAALQAIFGMDALLALSALVEQERVMACAALAAKSLTLAQRSEALVRARARILELEQAGGTVPISPAPPPEVGGRVQ
jgi:hypothetical protein